MNQQIGKLVAEAEYQGMIRKFNADELSRLRLNVLYEGARLAPAKDKAEE